VAGTEMMPTTNPHNEYLNITIQLGVIGLASLLYLFYCEWRVAASLTTTHERQLARGLVITFVIGCLFNSLLMDHTEGLLFAWASGLLFAGLKSPQKPGASAL
jgi:O-antigen ligase